MVTETRVASHHGDMDGLLGRQRYRFSRVGSENRDYETYAAEIPGECFAAVFIQRKLRPTANDGYNVVLQVICGIDGYRKKLTDELTGALGLSFREEPSADLFCSTCTK